MKESFLNSFGKRMVEPRVYKPLNYKPSKSKLAINPVLARVHKMQFGSSTEAPTGINVAKVSKNASQIASKAPRLQIHKL